MAVDIFAVLGKIQRGKHIGGNRLLGVHGRVGNFHAQEVNPDKNSEFAQMPHKGTPIRYEQKQPVRSRQQDAG